MGSFTYEADQFLLDGQPYRIISGAMHYFRVRADAWDDRLMKARAMGLNTVETYVPWNLHEPRLGTFDFNGNLNLVEFVELARKHDLHVIVRPGPYICAEWDFGGLPAWLLKDPGMRLRCNFAPYLDAVGRFFDALLPRLVPLQVTAGGPILAMQVENEYGSYGNDKAYLGALEAALKCRGIDVLLFTSDGPTDEMLQGGTLPHLLKTVNFGSRPSEAFAKLREYQPDGPLVCMEFWHGWFDHWGEAHHTRDAVDSAAVLDEMLAMGASVNLYMFQGGTNFGFTSGANYGEEVFQPTTTSYDYDAALNEAGDPTEKYFLYREVIGKYVALPELPLPSARPKQAIGNIAVDQSISFFDALEHLSTPHHAATPEPMEHFDQNIGFIHYRTTVSGPRAEKPLTLRGLHDRAQVFANGELRGTLERNTPNQSLALSVPAKGLTLDILVENMGRINYGPDLEDRKGITAGVTLGQQYLHGWTVFPLPLEQLAHLKLQDRSTHTAPGFYRARFEAVSQDDTYLALPGWTKGVCWLNGFNLGRYWERGPQRTLYVPGSLLKIGGNEVILFELHHAGESISFLAQPELG